MKVSTEMQSVSSAIPIAPVHQSASICLTTLSEREPLPNIIPPEDDGSSEDDHDSDFVQYDPHGGNVKGILREAIAVGRKTMAKCDRFTFIESRRKKDQEVLFGMANAEEFVKKYDGLRILPAFAEEFNDNTSLQHKLKKRFMYFVKNNDVGKCWCSLCDRKFDEQSELVEHINLDHAGIGFGCPICGIYIRCGKSVSFHLKDSYHLIYKWVMFLRLCLRRQLSVQFIFLYLLFVADAMDHDDSWRDIQETEIPNQQEAVSAKLKLLKAIQAKMNNCIRPDHQSKHEWNREIRQRVLKEFSNVGEDFDVKRYEFVVKSLPEFNIKKASTLRLIATMESFLAGCAPATKWCSICTEQFVDYAKLDEHVREVHNSVGFLCNICGVFELSTSSGSIQCENRHTLLWWWIRHFSNALPKLPLPVVLRLGDIILLFLEALSSEMRNDATWSEDTDFVIENPSKQPPLKKIRHH